MTHKSTRSTAAQTRKNNAANKQQVKNTANTPALKSDAAVPANIEDVEKRFNEVVELFSKAKKERQKKNDAFVSLKERYENEQYALATLKVGAGTGDEEDAAIVANRKVEVGLSDLLGKVMGALPQDSETVSEARNKAKQEGKSLSSAIAETKRSWSIYKTLYATIGINKQSDITPDLLKGLSPFLQVGTADGLRAALVSRTAVRKNGKAVKVDGKRVYKYTLRERRGWTAYGLYDIVELNYRFAESKVLTEDELAVRTQLLNEQVAALSALKAAKEAKKSSVPEEAANAASAEDILAAAVKAAAKAVKDSANATQHTTKGGELKKVVNG